MESAETNCARPQLPLAIVATAGTAWAEELAVAWSAPRIEQPDPAFALLVLRDGDRLSVTDSVTASSRPVAVDFTAVQRGRRSSVAAAQGIVHAVGLRRGVRTVVDATAGLGQDAFLLACRGCQVTALERSPVVAALLTDGLRRAAEHAETAAKLGGRLCVVQADARRWLAELTPDQRPDAVYLDPMLGSEGALARAKKGMQVLQQLVPPDDDSLELLAAARAVARRRVVVKRPRKAPPLVAGWIGVVRTAQLRFDIYAPKAEHRAGALESTNARL